ncbi:MAG TPA: aldehyde dehydrogenase [Bdellovibrionota bacterium]|jgi:aldehyde dehydrogenase (NAD+)|nr:aldehyde dehydrogenase [Bdellovibrionota bacterium]
MFASLIDEQRRYFATYATRDIKFRLQQLKKLEEMITSNVDAISAALHADLGKPALEAFTSEIAVTLEEVRLHQKNLSRWARPRKVTTPVHLLPAKCEIIAEPLGVALIISPWNYPFHLAIAPLVGALAAGNCVALKPSELAPHTAALLSQMLAKTFAPEYVRVIEGGVEETTALLKIKFDHIFFTGSTAVGRVVMRAAAEHLTPVTLELGGKSPTIVTEHADIDLAARRIAWGKFMNAGQTCVAPDYVYVHAARAIEFTEKLKVYLAQFYSGDPRTSDSYGRIISERHFDRLVGLLEGAKVIHGGKHERATRYLEPTLVGEVNSEAPLMREEIFGPILPILPYARLDEAFASIRTREKPLAAYFFSRDEREVEKFLAELSFGGGCVNDTILHLANPHLPFGGVGASGLGAYHGEESFLTFSHRKSVVRKSKWLDFDFRYPPYREKDLALIKRLFGAGS